MRLDINTKTFFPINTFKDPSNFCMLTVGFNKLNLYYDLTQRKFSEAPSLKRKILRFKV